MMVGMVEQVKQLLWMLADLVVLVRLVSNCQPHLDTSPMMLRPRMGVSSLHPHPHLGTGLVMRLRLLVISLHPLRGTSPVPGAAGPN